MQFAATMPIFSRKRARTPGIEVEEQGCYGVDARTSYQAHKQAPDHEYHALVQEHFMH